MSLESLISLRPMNPDDQRFVASSWFESYWKGAALKSGMPFSAYKAGQDMRIRNLLARSQTLIVYATSIPDEILGYAVLEPASGSVHWVYVKSAYRREGIATALCKGRFRWYTHASGAAGTRLARKLGLEFNPYLSEGTP